MTRPFSDAIALTSPNGKISKRALRAAQERIRRELFGDGLEHPSCPQPDKREALLREARELRELAGLGMKPRTYLKEAIRLEALAQENPC